MFGMRMSSIFTLVMAAVLFLGSIFWYPLVITASPSVVPPSESMMSRTRLPVPAGMTRVRGFMPMYEASMVTFPLGTWSENWPLAFVTLPRPAPFTRTCALMSGWPASSLTVPLMMRLPPTGRACCCVALFGRTCAAVGTAAGAPKRAANRAAETRYCRQLRA